MSQVLTCITKRCNSKIVSAKLIQMLFVVLDKGSLLLHRYPYKCSSLLSDYTSRRSVVRTNFTAPARIPMCVYQNHPKYFKIIFWKFSFGFLDFCWGILNVCKIHTDPQSMLVLDREGWIFDPLWQDHGAKTTFSVKTISHQYTLLNCPLF